MSHHDHGSMGDMDMGMSMTFHFGTNVTILFDKWQTTNAGELVGSAIGIFFLAFIYEALKTCREILYERWATNRSDSTTVGLLGGMKTNVFRGHHLVQTLLHMIQLVLSYFLMLIFMTYNVWLGVAITLGAGAGYWLFGWNKRTAVDITEHCH